MNEQHPPAERGDTVDGPIDAAPERTRVQPMPPTGPTDREIATEIGGPAGLEPTRYGDWERNGRCFDF